MADVLKKEFAFSELACHMFYLFWITNNKKAQSSIVYKKAILAVFTNVLIIENNNIFISIYLKDTHLFP